jgi:signal transduction histidine kinase
VAYGTATAVSGVANPRTEGAWIATLVFLLAFTVAVERPDGLPLLAVSAVAAVAMQALAPSNGAFVAIIATIAVVAIRLDAAISRRVALLTGLAFLAASAYGPHALPRNQVLSIVPGLFFTYLGSTAIRRLRAEQRRSEELLAEAIAGRDARIQAAALDERARLAREMHDVLAHTLSALSIQLEGTRLLAEQRSSDAAVVSAIERAGRLAREGLGEARRAVGSLRGETLPGPDLLPQLTGELEEDTGVSCRLQVEGEPVDLTAEARLALYRIAQEALTNVRKHADATRVDVTLRYASGGVELTVENDGASRPAPLPGGGYGVNGMRERAELLNGALEAGPTPAGYRVRLWIPVG